jgi:hypothetical protein
MQCAHFGGADLRGIDLETLDFSEAMLARTKFDLKYADKFIAEGYIVKRLADFCEVTDAEVKNEIILLGESGLLNSLRTLMMHYLDRSKEFLSYFFVKNSSNILLRIPVESIESLGKENIANFLGTLQQAKTSNAFVELFYMSDIRKGYVSGTDGSGEVSSAVYEKVGLKKVPLPPELKDPHKRTRKNTITLFPAYKGREEDQASIAMKIGGFEMTPTDTILSPIGLQNDATGLIRATILGLQMMELAQIIDGKDVTRAILDDVLVKILQRLKDICDPEAIDLVNLKPEDIVTLVTGAKDKIVQPLNKLINILPIKSFSAEELRQIYEHAKEIITAA